VLFSDAHLTALLKPSGMLVHRGMGNDRITLAGLATRQLGLPVHPIHRLDRGTSGVLVIAHTPDVAADLQQAWTDGRAQKVYLALVRGSPPPHAAIDHPVPRTEGGERVPARTDVRTLATSTVERVALVEARPHTGRFHQIRRHLKHLGHPVVCDANYGDNKFNRMMRERWGLDRLALHCERVAFDHPRDGRRLEVRASVTEDLARVLRALGLEAPAT